MIRLVTERLTLRTPLESDVTAYLAYRNEPMALVSQHLDAVATDEAQAFLREQSMRSADAPGWLMLAVEETSTRRLIGETGVLRAAEQIDEGNVGWWFHPAFRG